MIGTSAAVQATYQRSAYRQCRPAGRKAKYGRFSVLPRPEIYRSLRIKDSVKIDPCCGSGGFFLAAQDYLTGPANYTLDREQKEFLKNETFHGNELVPTTFVNDD